MAGVFARGMMKPPPGAVVNPAHPFARGLVLCVPFNDGRSGTPADDSVTTGWPVPLLGPGQSTVPPAMVPARNGAGVVSWSANLAGPCVSCNSGGSGFKWTSGSWLPTTACTLCAVRRKQDTTNRQAALFGVNAATPNVSRLGAHVPFNDGVVYWDFGGNTGANRLSVGSLAFSTTIPERWIFHAGPAGSAIWQNGIKVASQATAVTRTAASDDFSLNYGNGATSGDNVDLNYFAIYMVQWSDSFCQWWSAEPYAHFYPETSRRYEFLAGRGAALGGGHGGLTTLGVG